MVVKPGRCNGGFGFAACGREGDKGEGKVGLTGF